MVNCPVIKKATTRFILNCFIIAISISLISCGTMQNYSGAKLPKSEVAIIKPEYQLIGNLTIISVDDKKLGLGVKEAEVLPGAHKVYFGWGKRGYLFATYRTFYINAKAGQEYILRGYNYMTKGGMFFWIENKATGDMIAGEKPPE